MLNFCFCFSYFVLFCLFAIGLLDTKIILARQNFAYICVSHVELKEKHKSKSCFNLFVRVAHLETNKISSFTEHSKASFKKQGVIPWKKMKWWSSLLEFSHNAAI